MKANVGDLLRAAGLGRIADRVAQLALPAIRLTATVVEESQLAPGTSKLGGLPDLPAVQRWPEVDVPISALAPTQAGSASARHPQRIPMAFIAQFNMTEVAPYDSERVLPRSGMLYFFLDYEHIFDVEQDEPYRWKVLHYDGDLSALRQASPPPTLPDGERYRARAITFSAEICLPYYFPYERDTIERLGLTTEEQLTEEEYHAYWRLQERLAGTEGDRHIPIHRFLGHADPVQHDMQLECQLAAHGIRDWHDPRVEALKLGAADWRLLLQIGTGDNGDEFTWGDCARFYDQVQHGAVLRRDFDKVWSILQGS